RRTDSRPVLSDLRESGAIEQDADVVMFIHRNKQPANDDGTFNKNLTEIIIEKNRSGPIGSFSLMFKGEENRFVNYIVNEPTVPNFNASNGLSHVTVNDDYVPEEPLEFTQEYDSGNYTDEIF
ncbi:MAG: hypothetical protein J6R88_02555, partial [Clostridia bacterium]|nr:hypothetical protein [Clostridia bacterium]